MATYGAIRPMKRVTKYLQVLRCLFPKELPREKDQLDQFIKGLFETFNLPDSPNARFAIGSKIMHMGPEASKVRPVVFVNIIKKSMANEAAFTFLQDLKKAEAEYDRKVQADLAALEKMEEITPSIE